ncbi:MAG: GNAT family N-acetyltransferase [Candidatus Aenigmatarchaeota archaeon]|nr:MAG: GNAT family N-acetyltransferase [Candidatus Aenigmarchaeota archaeon]
MEITQRNFRESDLPEIIEFKKKSTEISFPGYKFDEENFKKKLLRSSEKEPKGIQVLESGGKIIGYIWFSSKKGDFGKYGLLHHLFIDENYRGKDLAGKLIDYAEKYFRSKGIKRVKLTVTETNVPAIKLYEKLNYKKTRSVMEKFL